MAETSQFRLPLVAAAQAQKHVTVNEALALLDCVAQLRVLSATVATPPSLATDGDAYLVGASATGAWAGLDGQLAVAVNGGWRTILPKPGWQCFNVETGTHLLFDGTVWLDSTIAATSNGAATSVLIAESDVSLNAGASQVSDDIIPSHSLVFGVTARVVSAITGAATGWRLGVAGSDDRFATGLGLDQGSYALGISNPPLAYYADTPLLISAEGGDFSGGAIRLSAHYMTFAPPRM